MKNQKKMIAEGLLREVVEKLDKIEKKSVKEVFVFKRALEAYSGLLTSMQMRIDEATKLYDKAQEIKPAE